MNAILLNEHINGRNKTNKKRTYHFYNDIINHDEFDGSKIKVDKKIFVDIDIYYLGYEYKKKTTECNKINSLNPLYLRIKYRKVNLKRVNVIMYGI